MVIILSSIVVLHANNNTKHKKLATIWLKYDCNGNLTGEFSPTPPTDCPDLNPNRVCAREFELETQIEWIEGIPVPIAGQEEGTEVEMYCGF